MRGSTYNKHIRQFIVIVTPPRAPPKRHGCLNTEHVTMKMKWDKEIYVTRTDVRSQILPVITSFFFGLRIFHVAMAECKRDRVSTIRICVCAQFKCK